MVHISGQTAYMDHAVVGFFASTQGNIESVLDLSSMQFGDIGRGPGGKGQDLIALDTMDEFYDRLEKVTHGTDDDFGKMSMRIGPAPSDGPVLRNGWLKQVARKVKARWENREKEPWCGHCGAPMSEAKKRCGACKDAYYCDEEHQKLAWPYHKLYCVKK